MLSFLCEVLNDFKSCLIRTSSSVQFTFPYFYLYFIIFLPLLFAAFTYIYSVTCKPLNRVRDLTAVGFWQYKEQDRRRLTMKQLANEAIRQRKCGDVPPVYPNGWFGVVESVDLKKGEARPIYIIGKNLVVFRGEDGAASVLDAYCPHLGAHLGIGGRVKGNCIECPFHGWQFRGSDGKCTSIPYADKVPEFANVKTWTVCEVNGRIFIWFHAKGEQPTWYPEEIQGIDECKLKYCGRSENYISAHIQDIAENGADLHHFAQIHEPFVAVGSDIRNKTSKIWGFSQHVFDVSWSANPGPDLHIATMKVTQVLKLFNKFNANKSEVTVKQIGPAIAHLEMDTIYGNMVIIQTVTPIGQLKQKVIHTIYADKKVPMIFAKFNLYGMAIMLERDTFIFNQKTFAAKPILLAEDNCILKFRRWYSQFYSDNSPKISFQKDTLNW